jgi:acyl-CoA thioester hydrolase
MPQTYIHRLRVRFAETDAQAVVFYANYIAYFDILMTEFWRDAVPGGYSEMIENGTDMVVIETTARYHAPALFDDELDLKASVTRLGNTSMSTALTIHRPADDATIVTGEIHHVFIDPATKTKRPIPDIVRAALEPYVIQGDLELEPESAPAA